MAYDDGNVDLVGHSCGWIVGAQSSYVVYIPLNSSSLNPTHLASSARILT
jgi:hypothetical protein